MKSRTTKWIYQQIKPFIPSMLIVTFIGIVTMLVGTFTAVTSKRLIDYAIAKDKNKAILAVIVFFVLILIQIGTKAVLSNRTVKLSERFSNKIRLNIFEKVIRSNWNDFSRLHSDDILTRLTSDLNIVTTGIVELVPNIISLGVQLIFAFIILFNYDKVLAVLALIIGPLFLVFYRVFRLKLKELHLKIQRAEGIYRAYLHESVQNISILKVFSLEDYSSRKMDVLQEERLKLVVRKNKYNVAASSMLNLGYYLGFILSFAWGALRLSQGFISYGTLTAFFQLVNQIQGPFISIARSIPQLISVEGSATRLMEIEELEQEALEHRILGIDKAGVEFEHLAFGYIKDKPVLKDVSASIKAGEIVSIIGPSGEGKTTLVRIILSLLEQSHGTMRIVSKDNIHNIEPSCRNIISYVPQGNTLFSGTILENIKTGKLDASMEEVEQALKDASAYDFVMELKDNVHSVIGERGIGLSEGQAQRIAIARAMIRNAPILILDEATSALDEDTELKILNTIKTKNPRPTCLLITHRPTVYNLTDRVLRLKDGMLEEKEHKLPYME